MYKQYVKTNDIYKKYRIHYKASKYKQCAAYIRVHKNEYNT